MYVIMHKVILLFNKKENTFAFGKHLVIGFHLGWYGGNHI